MKKIAAVIYEGFCMFEFSVALENIAMSGQYRVDFYGEEKKAYRSEEGMLAMAEYGMGELNPDDYDGLVLTGFYNEDIEIIKNEQFLSVIREFDKQKKLIAAISAAPVFLIKAGILNGLTYMCGCPKEGLREEGFTEAELEGMLDWDVCMNGPDRYIRHGHIITSVARGFREWGMEVGRMLAIETYPSAFGL